MDLPQFSGSQRRNAVLHAERLQFSARVDDAPRLCASIYQRPFGVLVLAEEDRLTQGLAENHDKGQLQQRQERRLMRFENKDEVRRDTLAGNYMQLVPVRFEL